MSIYLMDKAYKVTTADGVLANRVVVAGAASGECALPAAANAGSILGVTVFSQSEVGRSVSVRKAGTVEVVAAGAIAVGAPVNIADNLGRVKAISESSGTKVQCVGFAENAATAAGDVIEVMLSFHERTA
jgi:hypothetical protein